MKGFGLLVVSAVMNFVVTAFHFVPIVIGPEAYRVGRAGEDMISMSEAGSIVPDLISFGIACVFFVFGLYALSGAGKIRRLPFLSVILPSVAAIYTLRALAIIPAYFFIPEEIVLIEVIYAIAAFIFGIFHILGIKYNWQNIRLHNRGKSN